MGPRRAPSYIDIIQIALPRFIIQSRRQGFCLSIVAIFVKFEGKLNKYELDESNRSKLAYFHF